MAEHVEVVAPVVSPGHVNFGDLRRVTPISRSFGYDRGKPVDRYYIEQFLEQHQADIAGHVVEMGDRRYTEQFGGAQVKRSDVLDLEREDGQATIVADLTEAAHVPSDHFDCFIFTQTLQYLYEPAPAVSTLHRILRPGGVLLATFPVISQICRFDMDRWGDYWRFTSASVTRLLSEAFGSGQVTAQAHGNVLVAVSFLHGLAREELTREELDYHDPDYELLITARAVKRATSL